MKIKAMMLMTALFSTLSFATPSDKSVEELVKLAGYEELFYESIAIPLRLEHQALVQAVAQNDKMTDAEREKVLDAHEKYAQGLFDMLDNDATKNALKKAYIQAIKTNYTQGEVDAQLAFYGSDDGKSAIKKQEIVLSTYMKAASDANRTTIKNYQDKHFKKVQADIDKLLKK